METNEDIPIPRNSKSALRKSGKRVDQVIMSTDNFVTAVVYKEGVLFFSEQSKWRSFYFALCGGVLYWKKKETSTGLHGEVMLKDCQIEKFPSGSGKAPYGIKITKDDKIYMLAMEKEAVQEEWYKELLESLDKPPSQLLQSKKETRILRAQKKVGGSLATTAAGKKIIKEFLGTEGYKGIKIIKQIVVDVDGKKKAKETEEYIIQLGVKVILLTRNKELKVEDLLQHKTSLRAICDMLTHCAQFPFEYTPESIQALTGQFVTETSKTLSSHLSSKNIVRYNELNTYLSSKALLDFLYTEPKMRETRKEWNYLMKNLAIKLEHL